MKSNKQVTSRIALVVLGMHRSGTSALAGTLNLLGCDGPASPMNAAHDNPKGFFESAPLYLLHSKFLKNLDSSWDDYLPISVSAANNNSEAEFQTNAAKLVREQFGESRIFVLKDPRICRLVPVWQKVFSEVEVIPRYVLTHRNPLEVAKSLEKRNGIEVEIGLLIWLRHVIDAEAETRGQNRCFTSYKELLENWRKVAHKIEAELEVSFPRLTPQVAQELSDFLSYELRHQEVRPEQVRTDPKSSEWVWIVFAIMEKWVAKGESDSDFPMLDKVRDMFNDSVMAYAPSIRLMQRTQLKARELNLENSNLIAEKASLTHDLQILRDVEVIRVAELERQLMQQASLCEDTLNEERQNFIDRKIKLEQTIDKLHGMVKDRTEDVLAVQKTSERLQEKLYARTNDLAKSKSDLDQRQKELDQFSSTINILQVDIAAGQSKLREAEQREDVLLKRLEDTQNSMQELQQLFDDRNRELAQQTLLVSSREKEIDTKTDYIAEVFASRSWRITKPLRCLTTFIRCILSRG